MIVAELLGVPREVQPPDLATFNEYVRDMVGSLEVTDTARQLADSIERLPATADYSAEDLEALAAAVRETIEAAVCDVPVAGPASEGLPLASTVTQSLSARLSVAEEAVMLTE